MKEQELIRQKNVINCKNLFMSWVLRVIDQRITRCGNVMEMKHFCQLLSDNANCRNCYILHDAT